MRGQVPTEKGRARQVRLTHAQFAQRVYKLGAGPYSLKDYPFVADVLNRRAQQLVLLTARQISKSTILAILALNELISRPYWGVLYLSPSKAQTTVWSAMRLGRLVRQSPYVRDNFTAPALAQGIWRKEFTNESYVISTYASDDGDRARGNSADRVNYDEAQDIVLDEVEPVVSEAVANSEYGYLTYSGTPKTRDNAIQGLYESSTQREWVMKCPACGSWQFITRAESIDLQGLRCLKRGCRGLLNPREGHWHPMNLRDRSHGDTSLQPEGYHVPQVILPRNLENPTRWARILHKKSTFGDAELSNEVLGVSVALGARMLSEDDLRARCRAYVCSEPPDPSIFEDIITDIRGRREVYAGIDWSGEGNAGRSTTCLWVWGVLPNNKLKTLFFRLYPPGNPIEAVDDIARVCMLFQVKLVGADAGNGGVANPLLARKIGRGRVLQFQYGSFKEQVQKGPDRFYVDRTTAIDSMMLQLSLPLVYFPTEQQSEQFFRHVLALYEMVTQNGNGRRIWNKPIDRLDDYFHAMVFGWLGTRAGRGEFAFYDTGKDDEDVVQ